MLPSDLRPELRWYASGFLLTLFSGFGQTYFIALFADHLKADLALSEGQFGGLYTAGTLASAGLLTWAGKLADTVPLQLLAAGIVAGLALTSLGMAAVSSAGALVLVFFGLRFFGQGMLTHVAMTAMGRWFNRKRGKAVSIAALGLPASEALLPFIAVAAIGFVGWRQTWFAAALFLLAVAAPVLIVLLRHERHPATMPAAPPSDATPRHRQWTRGELLRSPLFYVLLAAVVAPAFIITAIFFNQVTIVAMKDWELRWFAATFPVLAGAHLLAALGTGWVVDRFGARRLPAVFLAALGVATLMLTWITNPLSLPFLMALIGLTLGCSATAGAERAAGIIARRS